VGVAQHRRDERVGVEVTGTLLSADDPRIVALIADWPNYPEWAATYGYRYPRSIWLRAVEHVLRELHPTANSDSLTLTARTLAPFPLQKPGVP
jgi:hypothetical protein